MGMTLPETQLPLLRLAAAVQQIQVARTTAIRTRSGQTSPSGMSAMRDAFDRAERIASLTMAPEFQPEPDIVMRTRELLQVRLLHCWDELDENSQHFLVTAEAI